MYLKSSTNVVITKLRSLYGHRLTTQDYNRLVNCISVANIANYLKNETLYRYKLEAINENAIHRGQLELLLKIYNFEKYKNFFNYKLNENINLFKYVILKNELEQMMTAIRLFNTGKMEKYVIELPVYLLKYTNMDLKNLAFVKKFDDISNIAKGTIYYKPLKMFKPSNGKINIIKCETELRKAFYENIISLVNKKDEKTKSIFLIDIDLYNFSVIYRLKNFFNKDKKYIISCLLPFRYCLDDKIINKMIDSKTVDDLYQILLTTKYKKYFKQYSSTLIFSNINLFSKKLLHDILKNTIRFTNSSQYIMIAYIYLMDIELKNLVTIIECIGYKFSVEEIKSLLII